MLVWSPRRRWWIKGAVLLLDIHLPLTLASFNRHQDVGKRDRLSRMGDGLLIHEFARSHFRDSLLVISQP